MLVYFVRSSRKAVLADSLREYPKSCDYQGSKTCKDRSVESFEGLASRLPEVGSALHRLDFSLEISYIVPSAVLRELKSSYNCNTTSASIRVRVSHLAMRPYGSCHFS